MDDATPGPSATAASLGALREQVVEAALGRLGLDAKAALLAGADT